MSQPFQHTVNLVKISEIRPNKYNPNIVPQEIMDQLVRRIKAEGFLQPVIVRNIPQEGDFKYEIVDGEHRFNAGKTIGYDEIPAIILDKNLPDAMIATINMNKLRGEFDTLKLAEVIHELHNTYSLEELEDKLGYTKEEQSGMETLLDFDPTSVSTPTPPSLEETEGEEPEGQEFVVILSPKQMKLVETAFSLAKKPDDSSSLVAICMEYLKTHGQKKSK